MSTARTHTKYRNEIKWYNKYSLVFELSISDMILNGSVLSKLMNKL